MVQIEFAGGEVVGQTGACKPILNTLYTESNVLVALNYGSRVH